MNPLNAPQRQAVTHGDGPLLVFAGAGSGKCVTPDTLVWSNGLRTFGSLQASRENSQRIQSGWGVNAVTGWYDDGERSGVKLELECGLRIDGTLMHRIWARSPDGTEGWKRLSDVTTQDYVALARGKADWGRMRTDRDEAYALGLMVADGHVSRGTNSRSMTIDKQRIVLERVAPVVHRWLVGAGGRESNSVRIRDVSKNHAVLTAHAPRFKEFFEDEFGYSADYSDKRAVPQRILRGTRESVIWFLKGYFDGDGYCDAGAHVSTASRVLAEQVQALLLGLGIFSRLHTKKIKVGLPAHIIDVRDTDAFAREIGFTPYGLTKDVVLAKLVARTRNTNMDVIPHSSGLFAKIARTVSGPYWRTIGGSDYSKGRRAPGFEKARRIMELVPDSEPRTELERIVTEHRAWSRVHKISPSKAHRIDCSVEQSHAFVGNGIINHNTSTITRRIAHLIEGGVDPAHILAVTFTNKAAGEMKERLVHLLGAERIDTLWLGTFHATGARILRALAAFTGRRGDFSIYDDHDQLTVVKQVMNELGFDPKDVKPAEVRDRICKAKERALRPEALAESQERFDRDIGAIWLRYEAWLEASNAFDFEDLLLWPMRLAEGNDEAGHRLKNRFQHVLVDEFQDTSHTQWRFVKAMGEVSGNIMVVGDDDQCIYEWRSADVNIIRGFADVFPNATVVKLEQNYRSSGNIVAAALDVIKTSKTRVDKRLWTEAGEGSPVRVVQCSEDRNEATFIASELKNAGTEGSAILYRTHQIARVIEEAFVSYGLPYVVLGGPRFYDRKEVRDVLAYLRLVQSPDSNVDLLRAINVPARGIGAAKVARLEQIARASGESFWKATATLAASGELRPKEQEGLRRFREVMLSGMSAKLTHQNPQRIAKMVIEESGYLEMWKAEARELQRLGKMAESDVAMDRAKNVAEILSAIGDYESDAKEAGKRPTLEGYLERVALMTSSDKKQPDGATVMMTIHAAKGLEFDRVYVAACEEGTLPLVSDSGDTNLDEERRLMYVAITRARRELTLSWSETRYFRGKLVPNRISRFLEAISTDVSIDLVANHDGTLHEAGR